MFDRPTPASRFWRLATSELVVFLAALLVLANGCAQKPPREFYPAEGLLLVNGEPTGNVCIAFHPLNGGEDARYPVGRTDGEGRFQLSTESGSYGAPPGDYVVTLVWIDPGDEGNECKCVEPLKHDLFKGYYANPELSGMRVTVRPAEDNSFRFYARRLPSERELASP